MHKCLFLWMILALFFSGELFARKELVVEESIPVFKKRKSAARPFFYLEKGMQVTVKYKSKKSKWWRVYFKKEGKTYRGWVNRKDVYWSRISRSDSKKVKKKFQKPKRAVGLLFEYASINMGSLEVTDSSNLKSSFDAMSGSSVYPGFYVETPYRGRSVLRAEFALQEYQSKGTGTYQGSSSVSDIELVQKFLSIRLFYRSYFGGTNFFYLAGGAVDNGSSVSLKVDDTEEDVSGEDLPFYLRLGAGFGYDLIQTQKWRLESFIKASTVLNADRNILAIGAGLGIAFSF